MQRGHVAEQLIGDEAQRALVLAELERRVEWARSHGHVYDLAVWQLVLARADEGLATLRAYVVERRARDEAPVYEPLYAVMAGEWDVAGDAARRELDQPERRFVRGREEYTRSLYALIADDVAAAERHLGDLRALADAGKARAPAIPAGAVDLVGGLVEHAQGTAGQGVDALLAWHLRRARARSDVFNSARGVVSLDTVTALLVAHRRGLTVEVADRFRAAQVPLLVLHLQEWDGTPLPQGMPITLETDLVAGPWLAAHGLRLTTAAPPRRGGRVRPQRRRRLRADLDEDSTRRVLERRLEQRLGSPWQLAGWSLMLGDPSRARVHLLEEAAAARRRWEESRQPGPSLLRALRGEPALPNPSFLREHFALTLVLRDENALRETSRLLAQWDARLELEPPFAHAHGYLDLVRHLLGGARPTRAEAEAVIGLRDTRVACVALVERDRALLERGLRGMVAEHVQRLEQKTSPVPPLCVPAIELAAAAEMLGVEVAVADTDRHYDAPVVASELGGKVGRLAVDVLATELWRR